MEDPSSATSPDQSWADDFVRTLSEQRARVQEFLVVQRERWDRVRAELTEHAERIAEELDQDRRQTARIRQKLEHRSAELSRQSKRLARWKKELHAKETDWEKSHDRASQHYAALAEQIERQQQELAERREELEQRRTEIDAAEAKLHHDRQAFTLAHQEHQAEVDQVAALRQRLEERIAEVADQREHLVTDRAHTEAQRRRIAQEFKARRVAHRKEIERRRAELESLETAQASQLREQLQDATSRHERLQREFQDLQAERDKLSERLADTEHRLAGAIDRISETEKQLADAEKRAAEAPNQTSRNASDDDLRRRYEMAVDDVREMKARNAELEKQLAQAKSAGNQAGAVLGASLNWEAEKRRILAALESDFEEDDEHDEAERLKIEEVIRKTDMVVAAKDREIADLNQLLADQSVNLEGVAVGAAAVGELLDQDAIIREERENLRQLQAEWEEKLRQAEIELSVERAKLARQRAEIEEKLRTVEELRGQPEAAPESSEPSTKSDDPPRRRWLTRLGLKDGEQK